MRTITMRDALMCLGLALAVASCAGSGLIPRPPRSAVRRVCARVIEGDTITVTDQDTGQGETIVRLIGIGTPERDRWYSIEARKFLTELVEGAEILVAWGSEPSARFRRQLAHVWLADGRFVQAELVRVGLAEAVPIPPKVLHHRCLRGLEREARAAKVGRWRDRPLQE